ncbi:MAG: flavodoxin [Lachnospiraceae bacterium]|nr:flavodoxin [Lachnospiraceae bacterium]
MKRSQLFICMLTVVFMLAGCGSRSIPEEMTQSSVPDVEAEKTEDKASETMNGESGQGSILTVYFSVPETDGVDAVAGASRVVKDGEVLGNCQYVANVIKETVGGDLFEIKTVQEYPGSHEPLLEFAYDEKAVNARPELAAGIENLDDYDMIYLVYPNWNADLPMPLYTFFEENDFSGKTIVPVVTHGGSGFSRTIQTISDMEPDADVISDGLSISRQDVPDAENDIKAWIESLE